MSETIKSRLRRLLGTAVYCPHCRARVDLVARALFCLGRNLSQEFGRLAEANRQNFTESMRRFGTAIEPVQSGLAEAARRLGERLGRPNG